MLISQSENVVTETSFSNRDFLNDRMFWRLVIEEENFDYQVHKKTWSENRRVLPLRHFLYDCLELSEYGSEQSRKFYQSSFFSVLFKVFMQSYKPELECLNLNSYILVQFIYGAVILSITI